MAWQLLLPVLSETLAAFGVTAEAAATGAAARAAATGATAAAEAAQATAATASAANAAGNAAGAASGAATGAKAAQAAESTSPTISQMFGKLWESFAGKGAEKAAAEQTRNQSLSDAYLGAEGGNPIRDHQSPSDKAAEDAAAKIKDKVYGGVTAMASSLAANTAGSVVGGYVTNPRQAPPSTTYSGTTGSLTEAYELAGGSGPYGRQAVGATQNVLSKTYDSALARMSPHVGLASETIMSVGGAIARPAIDLAAAIGELPSIMEGWGRELLASQQHLARFNGKLAGAFSEAERRDMVRDVESGRNTSGTTDKLSDALSDLQDEMQPMRDVVTNGFNYVAWVLIKNFEVIIRSFKATSPLVKMALDAQERAAEKDAKGAPFIEFMRTVSNKGLPNSRARKR